MTNFSMASKMATKMRNPSTESETMTRLLLDVLNVLNLKPKMQPQSVCAYSGLKQVFPRVYSIFIVYKNKRWAVKHTKLFCFIYFRPL